MNGMWKIGVAVAVGGAVGAVSRYMISTVIESPWPIATFLVNMVGSFILGILTGYVMKKPLADWVKAVIGTGFCGGLTTMSTFSKEAVQLFTNGYIWTSFVYVAISLVAGLAAGWIGLLVTGQFARKEEAP
ncbi:CrcB protein [Anoxybacillus tepidamans]|uniref:Fluoride-specific ion channel FluC n=1 Tax=Anoxybacteroides tepidamans TaxID=265948 RepID=A0A7W8IPV7_9BACL|nr:fluoride efflux transporter CrcB [Anoxybacillus tepidamans]MBB5323866.1 CrcB protein [Anoxybacillus tepidamans]